MTNFPQKRAQFRSGQPRRGLQATGVLLLFALWPLPEAAAFEGEPERSGRAIVSAVCAQCHAGGKDGAPRIGDKKAWEKLSVRGLTGLTEAALTGIRNMPAHGGSPDLHDLDIRRAITYMVNQSGGQWVEPAGKAIAARIVPARGGQYLVETQCGKCHAEGVNGAPRVGDRDAWVQRLKRGMDDVVRSALHGHGPMPARGGLADATFNEIRGAVVYMFNPASATMMAAVTVPDPPPDPYRKVVGDTEIFIGIASAESIRSEQKTRAQSAITNIPLGTNQYHINVTLRDHESQATITNAEVDVRVDDPTMRGESKSLGIIAINKGISYSGFFALPTRGRHAITVKIRRPDAPQPVEAKFSYVRE